MIDAKNVVTLSAGIVEDPEIVGNNNNVVRLRLAVDFAGNDRNNPENKTGYFNAVYFLNEDPNSRFVSSQIKEGKMRKGSQVLIVGGLQQQRYQTKEGKNASSVEIIVESMTYSGGARNPSTSHGTSDNPTPAATVPNEF